MTSSQPVNLIQFSHHVFLYNYEGSKICSGSILSYEWILTAAHCLLGCRVINLLAGWANKHSKFETQIHAKEFFFHPKYLVSSLENDIALLKLLNRLSFSRYIQPIDIPKKQQKSDFNDEVGFVIGINSIDDFFINTPRKLNFVKMRVIKNVECARIYGEDIIKRNMLCALDYSNQGNITGFKSSGGSFAILNGIGQYMTIGTVSFYISEENGVLPVGFMRISKYVDWIDRTTGIRKFMVNRQIEEERRILGKPYF